MHTLYSQILFAGFGLLFAPSVKSQDTLTVKGGNCEVLNKLKDNNKYENKNLIKGYFIKCDLNDLVEEVQFFEEGKFKKYCNLIEVDSVLNAQIKSRRVNILPTCHPDFNKQIYQTEILDEDGIYKNGLLTGKKYIYDKNGLLDKIEIWKNGKYTSEAQID